MTGPGSTALDRHLARVLGDARAVRFETAVPFHRGGPQPLDLVAAFPRPAPPHWLYVSYGLTELHEKKSKRADRSGWGIELALRLARPEGEIEPPRWPADLLQGLATYVYRARSPFEPGGQMDLNGPLRAAPPTGLTAVAFDADPLLGELDTPHGRMRFLQVIPLHADELAACAAWSTAGVIGVVHAGDPLRIADPGRPSALADAANARAVEEGIRRDGSATGSETLEQLEWSLEPAGRVRVTIGAYAVDAVKRLLAGRTLHGRRFVLRSPRATVVVDAAPRPGFRREEGALVLDLTDAAARALADRLAPQRGELTLAELPGLTVRIVPTEIFDPEGHVVRTIG